MPQDIDEPLRVTTGDDDRVTIVRADSIHVGRKVASAGPGTGPFGIGGPATLSPEISDVAIEPNPVPDLPAVTLNVGDDEAAGGITVRDAADRATIVLNGITGLGTFGTGDGQGGGVMVRASTNGPVVLITGDNGRITFMNERLETTLIIDGISGDIEFRGGDCAEDFDVEGAVEPGSVMCVGSDGRLRPCASSYDQSVVGVISGAGGLRPALRLDRRPEKSERRRAVAVVGKVECLVDAREHPIRIGDLLTTSSTSGHAMLASETSRSFGAVVGKSLGSLSGGRGLVPILLALQ